MEWNIGEGRKDEVFLTRFDFVSKNRHIRQPLILSNHNFSLELFCNCTISVT